MQRLPASVPVPDWPIRRSRFGCPQWDAPSGGRGPPGLLPGASSQSPAQPTSNHPARSTRPQAPSGLKSSLAIKPRGGRRGVMRTARPTASVRADAPGPWSAPRRADRSLRRAGYWRHLICTRPRSRTRPRGSPRGGAQPQEQPPHAKRPEGARRDGEGGIDQCHPPISRSLEPPADWRD